MNKKYYLVALVCAVAGTSVISSCKDTDEDLYTELRNELAFNAGQYEKLSQKLDELANKIANIKDGKDGVNGKDGEKGDKGESAYELAGGDATWGSLDKWLESLKGKDGKDGETCDCAIKTAQDVWEVLKDNKILTPEEYQYILDNLNKTIASLDIAGINIENVYNPAFGYGALPLGIQSNILTAYYSTITADKCDKFPTVEAKENGLTAEELELIGFDAVPYDLTENKINVGKVYLSVNPLDVNFAGKTPLLINTLGEESGITLSALEVCDEALGWGYTRATGAGLYVANATVTDLGATEKINLNLKDNAKKIKAALEAKTDAAKMVHVVYEMLNNVCQRKALKLTNKTNTVVSGFDLAAALVHPLGFETLKNVCDSKYMDELIEVTAPTTGKKPLDEVLQAAQNGLTNLYARSLPAIIVEEADGARLMSVSKSAPTKMGSTVTLHAVSQSAEILVPYIMKHLAVVDGPSATAVKNLNNAVHMNCIINHCDYKDLVIDLAGIEPGTYELVYSALDYAGCSVAQRFYFTVQ